jgi:AcrR family transcriptional regulator
MPRKRAYHHGDLRRTLLDTALRIVEKVGPGALSLRELAREAGVSHAAPYRHFASREALLVALGTEGFRGLFEEMQRRLGSEKDAATRMRLLGLAYVHHAVAHPGHFKIMFSSELHRGGEEPELVAAGEPTLQALVGALAAGQAAGIVRAGDPRLLAVSAWSMVHGLAMLLVDRQLAGLVATDESVDALATQALEVIARGLAP